MGTKICKDCKKELILDEFTKRYSKINKKHYYANRCRECEKNRINKYVRKTTKIKRQNEFKNKIKVCAKCKKEKPLNKFYFRKDIQSYRDECKKCFTKQSKLNSQKPEVKARRKERDSTPERKKRKNELRHTPIAREKNRIRTKQYRKDHYEELKEYRQERTSTKEFKKKRSESRRTPEERKKANEYDRKKWREDPQYKLSCIMKTNINSHLKSGKDGISWQKILGYTVVELKKYLESQFKEGMTWENHGKAWEIHNRITISWWNFNRYSDEASKLCN